MADDALVFDRHEAQLGDERSRTAKRLNETRFVWLTEGQLVDSEDLLMICLLLRPDRHHGFSLACAHAK